MAPTTGAPRRALDLDARRLLPLRCECFVGPVRTIEPPPCRAGFPPRLDGRGQRLGHLPRLSRCPGALSACPTPCMIVREPAPHGGAMPAQIWGDGPPLAAPTGHQDRRA